VILLDKIMISILVLLMGGLIILMYRVIKEQLIYWWTGHPETSWSDHPETSHQKERWPTSDRTDEEEKE
jgi:hypothetical protein